MYWKYINKNLHITVEKFWNKPLCKLYFKWIKKKDEQANQLSEIPTFTTSSSLYQSVSSYLHAWGRLSWAQKPIQEISCLSLEKKRQKDQEDIVYKDIMFSMPVRRVNSLYIIFTTHWKKIDICCFFYFITGISATATLIIHFLYTFLLKMLCLGTGK